MDQDKLSITLSSFTNDKIQIVSQLLSETVLDFFSNDNDPYEDGYTSEILENESDTFGHYSNDLLRKLASLDASFNPFIDRIEEAAGLGLEQLEKDEINNLMANFELKSFLTEGFKSFIDLVKKELLAVINNLNSGIGEINYIEAIRANQQRLYTNQSQGTSFNELLLKLGQSLNPIVSGDKREPGIAFVNKWIKKFGIGTELAIVRTEGVVTAVRITKDDRPVNIADLGYGVTQFLPLLLNIATNFTMKGHYHYVKSGVVDQSQKKINYPNGPILLIEEPESNLHPRLQSLLADFFLDVAINFDVTLLIETHSEYFIRKLQVLTAEPKEALQPKDTVIYYLDGNLPTDAYNYTKKINIEADGRLTNEFGPGFLDEATNWKIELMRLKNSHLNMN
nr:AAA family ATPase [Pontibacter sp. BAB1700]